MESYQDTEDRIQEALQWAEQKDEWNVAFLAREFNVPYQRLLYRVNTGKSKATSGVGRRALTESQEHALYLRLLRYDNCGIPARPRMITGMANQVLLLSTPSGVNWEADDDVITPQPFPRVGPTWANRFLKRHPALAVKKSQPLSLLRKQAHDPANLTIWFEKFHAIRLKYSIDDQDIWNTDQIGFRVGVGKATRVVVDASKTARKYADDFDDRTYVTVQETINAIGRAIPPQVILAGKVVTERMIADSLPTTYLLATSETGYSNDELNVQWIHHFNRHSRRSQVGRKRLLILDGWKSNLTSEFIEFALAQEIELFGLPPHSTHLLQPLDVGCFQPFKHWHAEAIDRQLRLGADRFTKIDFIEALDWMRVKTFKQNTILSAWREAGLVPFNPSMVINRVKQNEATGRQRTPSPSSADNVRTPRHLIELNAASVALRRKIQEEEVSTPTKRRIISYIKCSEALAIEGASIGLELMDMQSAAKRRLERSESQRHVFKGGSITIEDARESIKDRQERETELEQRRLAAAGEKQRREEEKRQQKEAKEREKRRRGLAAEERRQQKEAKKDEKRQRDLAAEELRRRNREWANEVLRQRQRDASRERRQRGEVADEVLIAQEALAVQEALESANALLEAEVSGVDGVDGEVSHAIDITSSHDL